MQTLRLKGSSNESMEAAMASAISAAEALNDAAKVVITPISFMEDDGTYSVRIIVDIFEEADLNEEELKSLSDKRSDFEALEEDLIEDFENTEPISSATELIDAVDAAVVVSDSAVDKKETEINDAISNDQLDKNEKVSESDPLVVSEAKIPPMERNVALEQDEITEGVEMTKVPKDKQYTPELPPTDRIKPKTIKEEPEPELA